MKKVEKLKEGLVSLTPTALVEKGRNHVESCTANPDVTLPPDFLKELGDACDALELANIAVRENGGKQDRFIRAARVRDLKEKIKKLAGHVQSQCEGDGEKITSTGFELVRSPQPRGVLEAPKNVRAARGKLPGELVVHWNGVYGRLSYSLFINSGDPNNPADWKWLKTTSQNSHVVTGLESDQQYYFRVRAMGTAGKGKMSDVTFSKAA
ncbi:MAG: fibronectin type III domain-containing protein [Flavobacteriales bacterium]